MGKKVFLIISSAVEYPVGNQNLWRDLLNTGCKKSPYTRSIPTNGKVYASIICIYGAKRKKKRQRKKGRTWKEVIRNIRTFSYPITVRISNSAIGLAGYPAHRIYTSEYLAGYPVPGSNSVSSFSLFYLAPRPCIRLPDIWPIRHPVRPYSTVSCPALL